MSAGGYETVPGTGAGSVEGADPYGFTGQAGSNIFGDQAQSMINKGMGAMGSWGANAGDPNSFMNKFLGDFSGLQSGITEATSPLSQMLNNQQQERIHQGMSQAGGQLSNLGALRSSAMGEAAGDVVGRAATDASTQLANSQLGLLGQLGNQAMGQRGNANSQMMGMPLGVMGMQGQFGEPMYVQPQVASTPGFWDRFGQFAGGFGNIASGVGALGKLF